MPFSSELILELHGVASMCYEERLEDSDSRWQPAVCT